MKPTFWHNRWENQQIGFHQSDVNIHLVNYLPDLKLNIGDTIFVPLCGKSLDLLWLYRQGFNVIGCELVESAVQAFFEENKLNYKISFISSEIKLYETLDQKIKIYQGDFFKLTSELFDPIHAIYDRASLIAFPPEMRMDYVNHLKKLFIKNFKMLLVALEYGENELKGPPFSVTTSEITTTLYHDKNCRLLHAQIPNDKSFSFQATLKVETIEKVYLIA